MRTLALIWLTAALHAAAQVPVALSREAFVRLVIEGHPVARQAALRTGIGEATVRSARGGFDPVATAAYDEKRFDAKSYYTLLDAGLKVPTWFGMDLLAGYEDNSGPYIDPQATTPGDGLVKAGVQVPVGQGLFIDQRRATLRKAQAMQRATEAERQQLLNELLLAALNDHADWAAAHRALEVTDAAVLLARQRFDAVHGSWRGGDRPAIDTLEAWLQVQDRLMRQQQAALALRNARLRLSNHLWDSYQRPLELQENVRPGEADLVSPLAPRMGESALDTLIAKHPLLLQAMARVDQLEVDRRLRAELMKPRLDLKYQWLGDAGGTRNEAGASLLNDGHRFGIGFQMPLLLRRERGELALAELRRTEAELGLERERLRIRNRVRERLNEIATYRAQANLGATMVENYQRLLSGENSRFAAGESALFLVNTREVPLIESRLRQVELEARLRKAFFALDHDAGMLWSTWTGR
jgi:outer membrane protein TolC